MTNSSMNLLDQLDTDIPVRALLELAIERLIRENEVSKIWPVDISIRKFYFRKIFKRV